MSFLNFQSCATCHGLGSTALFEGLSSSIPPSLTESVDQLSYFAAGNFKSNTPYLNRFEFLIQNQLAELEMSSFIDSNHRWGIIFASTKGIVEDLVWSDSRPQTDAYTPVLNLIKNHFPVNSKRSLVVSNACASSHGAVELAQRWLKNSSVDKVLIVAGDLIGPFILKGFNSLRALSEKKVVRPFDTQRDGLLLGDGLATVVLGNRPEQETDFTIAPVFTLCEGVSATRPDTSGSNLSDCFNQASPSVPELLIAHGTATHFNDLTESRAIEKTFANKKPPHITASKWSIGHTLGASGLIDLCLASEMLNRQQVTGIGTLHDSNLNVSEWIVRDTKNLKLKTILISSLGFGGVSAAMPVSIQDFHAI